MKGCHKMESQRTHNINANTVKKALANAHSASQKKHRSSEYDKKWMIERGFWLKKFGGLTGLAHWKFIWSPLRRPFGKAEISYDLSSPSFVLRMVILILQSITWKQQHRNILTAVLLRRVSSVVNCQILLSVNSSY